MRYLALNCTLDASPSASSTEVLLEHVGEQFGRHGVQGRTVRVVDHDVRPGVTHDEGDGDEWPALRDAVLDADILVVGTPIWVGHPSSVAQRVLERLDAFLTDTDERDQMRTVDRIGLVAVVGNEDGAHHVGAELFQALNDCGFTVPPGAMTYWVGEAMGSVDLKDLEEMPETTAETTATMVANAVHLGGLLRGEHPYPAL